MKKVTAAVVTLSAIVYLTGCAKPQIDMIEDLRNATLALDRNKSVGQVFSEYEYFSSVLWHQEKKDTVKITGIVALERLERVNPKVQRASISYSFTKQKSSYTLTGVALQMQKAQGTFDAVMDPSSGDDFYKPLQMVYQNRFLTR